MNTPVQYLAEENWPPCVKPPDIGVSGLPDLKIGQVNETHGLFQCLPHHIKTLLPTLKSEFKETQFDQSNQKNGPTQKKFIIFDQSGNQTSLFLSSMHCPSHNLTTGPTEAELASKSDHEKLIVSEEVDETHVIDDNLGSEMHENTEEINALLYSDDDYDNYDTFDDETSTGYPPITVIKHYDEQEEEVASSFYPSKRQRLLDEWGDKGDEAESSVSKERIRDTLRILESIVPSAKGRDPLLIIDEAISFLSFLKLKVEADGAAYC